MEYEEFKENILKGLKTFYGEAAEISVKAVIKNNDKKYDGIYIFMEEKQGMPIPVIYLESYYEAYIGENKSMEECIGAIIDVREQNECCPDIARLSDKILEWNAIKEEVYPILLSAEENEELLKELVSNRMLDLAIVYIIREKMETGGYGSIKIAKKLLDSYGISKTQLHEQAMRNLERDGYTFVDMEQFVIELLSKDEIVDSNSENMDGIQEGKMYILRNESGLYGAAGMLNKKLLQEFVGDTSCYILPSSVHETIFIPVSGTENQKELDDMVAEINETQLRVEERLSNHSYYYDAQSGEIRICA